MQNSSFLENAPVQGSNARTNWAGNHVYRARLLSTPLETAGLRERVTESRSLRVLGTRHSFNAIADCEGGDQLALNGQTGMTLDTERSLVTVGAGTTYAELAQWLNARGFALPNLASLPHISVAGATQTGTHGSGLRLGSLATSVAALEMIDASGRIGWHRRETHGETFHGMVVALGSLGVVTRMQLAVQPSFSVRQMVYEDIPFDTLLPQLEAVMSAGYSVSLFTHWNQRSVSQLWLKQRTEPGDAPMPDVLFGARAATVDRHPLPGHGADNCTPQRGEPGPWYERLPHFRSGFTPSSGNELQTEYFVPFAQGAAAIEAVAALGDAIAPHLFVSELRAVAADALWLSPAYDRASLALHFTWKPEWPAVKVLLPRIEAALAPFDARPHWGKLFTASPAAVRAQYPRLAEFRALAGAMDPQDKFRNEFVRRYIFSEGQD